jgi:hypothetical protein
MANRLQLKRGTTAPGTIFYEGEPIYNKTGKVLYVGDDGGTGTGAGSAIASADAYSSVLEILYKTSSTDSGSIRLYEDTDNGTNYVAVAAPALISSNFTLRLPDNAGTDGYVLKTDGSGNLDWVAQTSGFSGFTISDSSNTSSITDGNTVSFSGGTGITAAVTQDGDVVTYSLDAELQALSSVTSAADALPYFTGSETASVTTLSSFGRSLIDDADAAAARTTLGVDQAGTDNSTDVTLAGSYDYLTISGQAITLGQIDLTTDVTGALPLANGGTNATTAGDARTNLGLAIGTDVQAHGDILDDLSGLTQAENKLPYFDSSTTAATTDLSSFGRSLIDDADAAAARTTLGVDQAGTDNSTDVTLVTTTADYLSIVGQAITLGQIDLATDVTGSLPNANLANSTITVSDGSNSTATALGGTITFAGTANEVTVGESAGTITVGLPDDVTIGNDLTVTGNLYVTGTTTQVNTSSMTVEDRTIELGLVNGSAPSATTTWDSGVTFNYFQTSAKKSGLIWLNNQFMAMLSELSESADTGNADPQITASAYAPVAAGGLYVGGIAAGNEVINSSQAAVNLTFDGGTY